MNKELLSGKQVSQSPWRSILWECVTVLWIDPKIGQKYFDAECKIEYQAVTL